MFRSRDDALMFQERKVHKTFPAPSDASKKERHRMFKLTNHWQLLWNRRKELIDA